MADDITHASGDLQAMIAAPVVPPSAFGGLIARCTAPGCGAATVLEAHLLGAIRAASLGRLEDQIRCTCGSRRGRLEPWALDAQPARDAGPGNGRRVYLFGV